MNIVRFFYSICVAAIALTSFVSAGQTNHCGCNKSCKKTTPVVSFEKCLKDIRGTACVTSITRNNGGPITAATIVPRRGIETFSIQNIIINNTNIQPLLNAIFCSGCGAGVSAARVVELQFYVVFKFTFKKEPSVLL
jgi:hypothetical protein